MLLSYLCLRQLSAVSLSLPPSLKIAHPLFLFILPLIPFHLRLLSLIGIATLGEENVQPSPY